MDARIATLTREGCGIRSTGRVLGISPTTVIARIKRIAARLGPGPIPKCRSYEVDELSTFVGHKQNRIWVAYAMDGLFHRYAIDPTHRKYCSLANCTCCKNSALNALTLFCS
jgi:hypothetical protein